MLFDKSQREEFAKAIIGAVNLNESFEGKKFIENFKYTEGIKMTETGKYKIIDWIKSGSGNFNKVRGSVKENYSNPRKVYDLLVSEASPPLD